MPFVQARPTRCGADCQAISVDTRWPAGLNAVASDLHGGKRMGGGTAIRVLALINPGTPASPGISTDPQASLRRSHKRSALPAWQALRQKRRIFHATGGTVKRVTRRHPMARPG